MRLTHILRICRASAFHIFLLEKRISIQKLMLEGGSVINGAFERENMIDELSIVLAPIVAGEGGKSLFFESTVRRNKNAALFDSLVELS